MSWWYAGQISWRWSTGYSTGSHLDFQLPRKCCLWMATIDLAFVLTLGCTKHLSEFKIQGLCLQLTGVQFYTYSCISRNLMPRNKHGNWSLVVDASLVSVGSQCKALWRDTSNKQDGWNSHNCSMFCIDKVISKKLQNTRYNNPPWIRFKQTRINWHLQTWENRRILLKRL